MDWNQFGDFIDLDTDPHSSNFVDPHTNNADPHHLIKYTLFTKLIIDSYIIIILIKSIVAHNIWYIVA